MKILIADDRNTTRFILNQNLTKMGYDVVEAPDGEAAWKALNSDDPPRIAVIDWMMPKIDGVEICRRLSAKTTGPFIYTILLTSKTEREDLVYALNNGAHNFQSKPISPEEIRAHINVGKRLVESDDKLKEYAEGLKTYAVEMERLATVDSLTGVFNRRHFLELASKELSRTYRYKRALSVILIDIDFFKKINDTYGHAAGDQTLKMMADACIDALRDSDIFGRIGGEEFAAVLPEIAAEDAFTVAERLRKTLSLIEIVSDEKIIRMTVSMGVTAIQAGDRNIEMIFKRADEALYKAKNQGRNKVVLI